jgi:hypothetical protein
LWITPRASARATWREAEERSIPSRSATSVMLAAPAATDATVSRTVAGTPWAPSAKTSATSPVKKTAASLGREGGRRRATEAPGVSAWA